MDMGWTLLGQPYETNHIVRPCRCGKGRVITCDVIMEISDFPPFERGYPKTTVTCPNKCEKIFNIPH